MEGFPCFPPTAVCDRSAEAAAKKLAGRLANLGALNFRGMWHDARRLYRRVAPVPKALVLDGHTSTRRDARTHARARAHAQSLDRAITHTPLRESTCVCTFPRLQNS